MRKLLFLLPLLLLASCKPAEPEPPKATPKEAAEVLEKQISELQAELTKMVEEARDWEDLCTNIDTVTAWMDMLAPKYRATALLYEASGQLKQTMQAMGAANRLASEASRMRRDCR